MLIVGGGAEGEKHSKSLAQTAFLRARELVKGIKYLNFQDSPILVWLNSPKGERARDTFSEATVQEREYNPGHCGRF